MSTSREQRLPAGWEAATLGDLAEYLNGVAFKLSDWGNEGVPIIRIQNLTNPSKRLNLTKRNVNQRLLIRKGDLLFSWSATIDAFLWNGQNAWLNQHIFKVECEQQISKKFLYYLLRHATREILSSEHIHGSTMQHINRGPFLRHPVHLPPRLEQERIVEVLDELFSDFDSGVAALERARNRLKRYRESVLKTAVGGALTALWRTTHPNVEPASRLLERVLAERRLRWEKHQLREFAEKQKPPLKNWKARYKEPGAPDTADLPPLPEGWCWATVKQCSSLIQYGSSARASYNSAGIPILRMGNVTTDGRFLLDDLKYLPPDHSEFPDLFLNPGDLLFNRTNSADLVGKTAVYSGNPSPCSFASYLIRVRLVEGVLPEFLVCSINGIFGKLWIKRVVNQTVGQANVNGTKLAGFTFPLPPRAEQSEIVKAVEEQLSIIDHLGADLDAKLIAAQSLRQGILRRAFSGRLVPQNPNDEPASELLKRIADQREARAREASGASRPARITYNRKSGRRGRPRRILV